MHQKVLACRPGIVVIGQTLLDYLPYSFVKFEVLDFQEYSAYAGQNQTVLRLCAKIVTEYLNAGTGSAHKLV